MKLVIAMRKDLNMRKGKMVAQGAHAACMPFIAECDDDQARLRQLEKWVESGMTKVCVVVESEQELDQLVTQAIHAKVPVFTVRDAGRTEIAAGTVTCAAFGPATAEELDPITGKLVLL